MQRRRVCGLESSQVHLRWNPSRRWSRSEGEGWEREEVMQTEGGREKQREGKLGKLPPHLLVHDVSDAAVSCRLGPQSRTSSPRSLWTFNSVLFVSACVLPFYLSLSLNTWLSSGNLSFGTKEMIPFMVKVSGCDPKATSAYEMVLTTYVISLGWPTVYLIKTR